ncbi:hypothetical protein NIES4102_08690 [Chondrocystis sp. NIES-4102]|nr:hypothetical protein NIES4102_08690 [Chondrocystis sp. NIES-4102]
MSWTWELYQNINGEIPKELLAFFIRLISDEEKLNNSLKPIVSAAESKRLQINLRYLRNSSQELQ